MNHRGPPGDAWKRHIIRQLKRRDQRQHAMFQDLIRVCTEHTQFVLFFKKLSFAFSAFFLIYSARLLRPARRAAHRAPATKLSPCRCVASQIM
uniref:Uncharacterized protein n=1 Tax=Myripristis murdjan TaxID=586833 RepID=A0A667X539_9TELE